MENLKYINSKNDKVYIGLRANFNNDNIDSLVKFKQWEKENFNNPKFEFYYESVSKFSDRVPDELLADKYSDKSMDIDEEINNGINLFKKYDAICTYAYPNNYAISTDGKIAKCDNFEKNDEYMFMGYLSENGEVIFKDNKNLWEEDFEIEACKECLIYPICCARACPAKKVLFPAERPECRMIQENLKNRILHYAENKM